MTCYVSFENASPPSFPVWYSNFVGENNNFSGTLCPYVNRWKVTLHFSLSPSPPYCRPNDSSSLSELSRFPCSWQCGNGGFVKSETVFSLGLSRIEDPGRVNALSGRYFEVHWHEKRNKGKEMAETVFEKAGSGKISPRAFRYRKISQHEPKL